jgi:hypothetical protein
MCRRFFLCCAHLCSYKSGDGLISRPRNPTTTFLNGSIISEVNFDLEECKRPDS